VSLLDRLRVAGALTETAREKQFSLMDRLGRTSVAVPDSLLFNPEPAGTRYGKQAVGPSRDLSRILELPRRTLDVRDPAAGKKWTSLLRRFDNDGTCDCLQKWGFCIKQLLPIQGNGLEEAASGGLLGLIGVGEGKCLGVNTEVFDVAAGERRRVVEPGPLAVASVQEGHGLCVKPGTAFPSGSKVCVRVTLRDGASIDASTDHEVLTARGWVPAANLTTCDFVAVPSEMPQPWSTLEISDDEVSLLGLLYADGGFTSSTIRFTDENESTCAEFQRCALTICGGYGEGRSRTKAREFTLLKGQDLAARWDLHDLSKHKRLHPKLWGLSTPHVRLFLNRFWACDGHLGKGHQAECTLASEGLVDDIRFLLLRLGVRSRKHFKLASCNGKKFDAWRIQVSGADLERFLEEVGPVIGCEHRYWELLERLRKTTKNPNFDSVPIGRKELNEIHDEAGWVGRKTEVREFTGATDGQYLSRQKFLKFCQHFDYQGRYAKQLLLDRVAWERVQSVKNIGEQPVYDVSVRDTHNLVANGMVVHNTGLDILLPMVLPDCQRTVLLIPSNLKAQFLERDYPQWSVHFKTPQLAGGRYFTPGRPVLHVVAYSELSSAKSTDLLKKITPDTVICDEAQNVRRRDAARTKRFLRHFSENPRTRLVALSGTLTSRSLEDYAHLSKLALGEGSPLPLHWPTVEEWSGAIDAERPNTIASPIGALRKLCNEGEHVREGFRRRLVETKGVVATEEGVLGTSLILNSRMPALPPEVEKALQGIRNTWQRPDGEELTDAMTKARVCRELAQGFYYRWIWPRGESKNVIEAWLFARRDWHKEVREKLKHSREFMDSPLLLTNAAARWHDGFTDENGTKHEPHTKHRLTWDSKTFLQWRELKETAEPQTEAVWVSDYLVQDAAAWAKDEPGIIWYEADAFGRKLQQLGLAFFGPGAEASSKIIREKGDRPIVASLKAHGTGKNLQIFYRNLIASPPSSGKDIEQLLGRTHRLGQKKDEVYGDFYQHTEELREALEQATRDARYIEQSTGGKQRLLYAARTF